MTKSEQDFNDMSEQVDRVGGCFGWFFAFISIILLICLLSSCNPFISKELRRKNKCNRKLERVVRKCPELLKTDTIKQVVEIEVSKVQIDSFITIEHDTTWLNEINNDTVRQLVREKIFEYFPFKDTIAHYVDGYTFLFYNVNGNIGYTVTKPPERLLKEIETPIEVIKPVQLTITEQIMNVLSKFFWWFVLLVISILAYKIIMKKIKD